ncbi:MAG: PIN domain-containing protein [Segetibacter sp.]
MEQYVLDTSAVVAFFRKEAGAEKVKALLDDAAISKCDLFMHNASVAEFYYDLLYTYTEQEAAEILERLNSYPILFNETISKELIKWIGYFKTSYKVSFADSFVLATAKMNDASVLTSDHHEFDEVEKKGDVMFK